METLLKSKDDEIVKLLADNRELSEELRQCQADKEFVWSLWKRLQVSSPDLTQAISLVMQREKEKSETKDRKILEILQSKDEQIENLQETVTSLKSELDKLVQMKVSLEGTRTMLTQENEDLKRLNEKTNEKILRMEELGKNETVLLKRSVEDIKQERDSLNEKVTKLLVDLQTARVESHTLDAENEKLKKKARNLEEENSELLHKCQKLQKERESLSEEIICLKSDLSHYKDGQDTARRELDSKQQNTQNIKRSYEQLKSHTEEQNQVILQLQALNDDHQRVLKQQEKAYKDELSKTHRMYADLARKYESLEQSHKNLKKTHEDLRERVGAQDKAIYNSEKELKKAQVEMATGRRRRRNHMDDMDDLELHVASQQEEIDILRRRLKEKNMQLAEINNDNYYPTRDKDYGTPDATFSPIIERARLKSVHRSRSLSPPGRHMVHVNRRLLATEEKLDSTKRLLDLKKQELKELQKAHDKRLNRLKEVQANYRELKDVVGEKDILSPRKAKAKKKPLRPSVKDLRRENSEGVWNELAYYKRENRNLKQEKMVLEDDLDNLRVQAAMDKATVQELNMCLRQEKDDLMMKLRQHGVKNRLSSTPKKKSEEEDREEEGSRSVSVLRHLTRNLERKLENATEDNRVLKKERNELQKELRSVKEDNKALKRDVTESRQSGASLRRDIVDLRRKVEDAEDGKIRAEADMRELNKEVENARTTNLDCRDENNVLRSENSDLRSELKDLQAELRDITNSLEIAEAEANTARSSKSSRSTTPAISGRASKFGQSSKKRLQSEQSLESEDGDENSESEVSSLGQNIVRAARSVPRMKGEPDDDDDDTLVDDDVIESRPTRSKRSARVRLDDLSKLKLRLASMQKQCRTLINEKQNAVKDVSDQKDRNSILEAEIQGLQNRLKASKTSIQKLHREVEVISREKEELQRSLEALKNAMPEPQKYSDTDYRLLENKLRAANSDAHHYMEQTKKVQKEGEEKLDTIATLKEKVSRLERDVAMKRQLIEEQRAKLKQIDQTNKTDQQTLLDLEDQFKNVTDELAHKKNYIDSLKRQVQAIGRDKARYEQSYNEARAELEKRSEQVSVEQARKLEAEHLANQLESTVEQQLNTLATKSEQALEKLQGQLNVSLEKNREYSTCIQILTNQMADMVGHLRGSIYHLRETARQEAMAARDSDPTMSRAQSIACSILNMSKADFDDLMTPVDVRKREEEEQLRAEEMKGDSEWKMKVEEISHENPPFAKSLNRLLWDKIQDAVRLAEEKCHVQYEIATEKT